IQILTSSSLNLINPLLIAITVLVIVYFIFSSAPYFYFRYLVFIQILSLPVAVIVFSSLFVKLKKYLSLFMILILIFSFAMQAYFYFHSGKSALGITMRPTFIKENFDENKLIGAFQSGALGYYVDNVVNLDGKISIAALQSLNKGSIEQYIDDEGIDVLVEWDDAFVWILDSLYLQNNWDIYTMDIGDGLTRCYVRKGFSH
ncbi:MAG: chitin synthase, partial [Ignavibacteriaceae bacterium]|nr:chitin synthase [Ignavibacteriaceae bacterium]